MGVEFFRKINPVLGVELYDGINCDGSVRLPDQISFGNHTDDARATEREMGVRELICIA